MADDQTGSGLDPQILALIAALTGMQGGGLGQNLLQFQGNNPFMGIGQNAAGQLVQRPNFVMGNTLGAQMVAPGGGNVHFTGGSPFPVNPWPTRIGNTLSAVGRIVEALQTRKVNEAAKAKAGKGATSGG